MAWPTPSCRVRPARTAHSADAARSGYLPTNVTPAEPEVIERMPSLTIDVSRRSRRPRGRGSIRPPSWSISTGWNAAIERMAAAMAERGVALRPHAKTHKSIEVGRRQLAAGAGAHGRDDRRGGGRSRMPGSTTCSSRIRSCRSGPRPRACGAWPSDAGCASGSIRSTASAPSPRRSTASGDRVALLIEIDSGGAGAGVRPGVGGGCRPPSRPMPASRSSACSRTAATGTRVPMPARRRPTRRCGHCRGGRVASRLPASSRQPSSAPGRRRRRVRSARGAVTEERPGTYVFGDRQQVALGSIAPDAVAATGRRQRRQRRRRGRAGSWSMPGRRA